MNILVTGGAGFIGSHIVEHLIHQPDIQTIRIADNFVTGRLDNLAPFLSRVQIISGDLTDPEVCCEAVDHIDVVLHQAAIPSVPRSVENPLVSHFHGVHLTINLLDAARRAGVRRFVMAGSSSAYGDIDILPKHEDMIPKPLSPYAATKIACEQYAYAFARCYSIDTVSLRYFNVFGPRQDPNSPYSGVVARFCTAFCNNAKITVYGDGEQSRDFTYVANVVQANLLAARHPEPFYGQIFNIGAGARTSLNKLIQELECISGRSLEVVYLPARAGDVRHSLADIQKANSILRYHPTFSLREGLNQTLSWYRSM